MNEDNGIINDSLTIMERDLEQCLANFRDFVKELGIVSDRAEQRKVE